MATPISIVIPEFRPIVGLEDFTLSAFVSELLAAGSCFCCGAPTDLLLDESGRILVRCSCCGAEVS